MAILDVDFFSAIQRKLLEPANGGQSFFSGHWTFEELCRVAHDRQDALLNLTHLQIGVARIAETQGQALYDLPDDWMSTVAVVRFPIQPSGAIPYRLDLADTFELDHAKRGWISSGERPIVCFDRERGTHVLEIAPPSDTGVPADPASSYLLVYYVPRSAKITGHGESLTVPDEVGYSVLQYGILADLLGKVGRGQDPVRAGYCRQRWDLGVEATKLIVKGLM